MTGAATFPRLGRMALFAVMAWLVAAGLTACQPSTLAGVPGSEAVRHFQVGAPGQRGANIAFRIEPLSRLTTQARVADIDHLSIVLMTTSGATAATATIPMAGEFFGRGLGACAFDGVPEGTYYVTVDAQDAGNASLVQGGQPVRSANNAVVGPTGVSYTPDTTGRPARSLLTRIQLVGNSGAATGRLDAVLSSAFGSTFVSTLLSGGQALASFTATAGTFHYDFAGDGTYDLWAFAATNDGRATPARPAGSVTLSGGGSTASGTFNLNLNPTTAIPAGPGVAPPTALNATAVGWGTSVAADAQRNLYWFDNRTNRLMMTPAVDGTYYGVAQARGLAYTIAGAGTDGHGSPALQAALGNIQHISVAADNTLILSYYAGVWALPATAGTRFGIAMQANHLYRIAGHPSHQGGSPADGTVAAGAQISLLPAVADAAGHLVYADPNRRVRVIARHDGTFYGQAMSAGRVYTLAGDGTDGNGGEGGPATAARVAQIQCVGVGANGDVYVGDLDLSSPAFQRVCIIPAATATGFGRTLTAGTLTRIGTIPNGLNSLTASSNGDVIIGNGSRFRVLARTTSAPFGVAATAGSLVPVAGTGTTGPLVGENIPATTENLLAYTPSIDPDGNLVYLDPNQRRVRMVAWQTGTFFNNVSCSQGHVATLVGNGQDPLLPDGVPVSDTPFWDINSIGVDAAGNTFVITESGDLAMIANENGTVFGRVVQTGYVYVLQRNLKGTLNASLRHLRVDAGGNLLIAARNAGGSGQDLVVMYARNPGTYYTVPVSANTPTVIVGGGSGGDNGPALGAGLELANEFGNIALDGSGNLFIGEPRRVRLVPRVAMSFLGARTPGTIYTVAGGSGTGTPPAAGLGATAFDFRNIMSVGVHDGHLVVTDGGPSSLWIVSGNGRPFLGTSRAAGQVHLLMPESAVFPTGDGGPATSGSVSVVSAMAFDPAGNLYLADVKDGRIRLIGTNGYVYTVLGTDVNGGYAQGFAGGSLTGTFMPFDLAVSPTGRIVTTDRRVIMAVN